MAKALDIRDNSTPLASALRAVWTLRLALGFSVLCGATLFFLGTSWDIQWHSFIGRDRTLIPPHIVMLCGVALSGIAALLAVCVETLWARRNPLVAGKSTDFADAFHGAQGAYIAGFGALDAAVAFPLDSYWHALYGIDVAIWAPFHIMFAVGMAIAAFGGAYMLISAAHLAESESARGASRAGYAGALVALAVMLAIFTLLLFDAYSGMGTLHLGFTTINVFMPLAALLGTCVFVAAAYALPWRWSATFVAAISLVCVLIVFFFVPPATNLLLQAEQLAYRRAGLHLAIVALDWPALFIVGAVIIDSVIRRARRGGWSAGRVLLTVAASSLVGFLPAPLIYPLYPINVALVTGSVGFIVSLLLGLAGGYVGSWLGRNVGEVLHVLER